MELESDLNLALCKEYAYLGVKINPRGELREALINYLTVHSKIIRPIRRRVLINPDFQKKLVTHPKRREIEMIRERLECGVDVNLFQNKKLFQTNFHDHLLSEWRIYHFHLSTLLEAKGRFFKKTNALLFVYINQDEAILLDTDTHGKGVFADERWLKILDDYFPEILRPYVDSTIEDIQLKVTPKERQTLWSKGFSLGITKVNDKIIRSPGIGRVASGHSTLVIRTANEIMRWIKTITDQFSKYWLEICEHYHLEPNTTKLKINLNNPFLDIVDDNTDVIIISFPKTFNINRKEKE